jgi:hypothetical protein
VSPARTKRQIERLHWRAGFGATPRDLKRLVPRGLSAAVDELLAPPRGPAIEPGPTPTFDGKALDPENEWSHDVLWWLDRAVRTRQPLVERMTLNLHDHFATSNHKVGDVKLMMAQYRTLRKYALGSFRQLTHEMLEDHAMQQFLDLIGSNQESPNENFARELLELFTLGVNNGYTERDVRAEHSLASPSTGRPSSTALTARATTEVSNASSASRAGLRQRTSSTSQSIIRATPRTSAKSSGATSHPSPAPRTRSSAWWSSTAARRRSFDRLCKSS